MVFLYKALPCTVFGNTLEKNSSERKSIKYAGNDKGNKGRKKSFGVFWDLHVVEGWRGYLCTNTHTGGLLGHTGRH